jgi:hypothetical protein
LNYINIDRVDSLLDEPPIIKFLNELTFPCVSSGFSYIRILNASIVTAKIDVYIDDTPIAKNLVYKDFSNYFPILNGMHNIRIYLSNNLNTPIFQLNANIAGGKVLTLPLEGNLDDLALHSVEEDLSQRIYPDRATFRIVNLTREQISIDVKTVRTQEQVYNNILSPKGVSEYTLVYIGEYRISINLKGQEIYQLVQNIPIYPSSIYALYIVGSLNPNSLLRPLEIAKISEGSVIIRPCL